VRGSFSDVEIIDGSTSTNKRQALMRLFNSGVIKCLLVTVKEGVDLQGDTITLFNISVDWNPTDAKQVEGRSWRQGNKNAYVIIAYPLTANGSDMAIYQKLQDKTNRLKGLWDRSAKIKSSFDLDEFDPESIKLDMISRVDKLAPFLFNQATAELKIKYQIALSKKNEDEGIINGYRTFIRRELELRSGMMLFSRLPKYFEKKRKLIEIIYKISDLKDDLRIVQDEIAEVKNNLIEYTQLISLKDEIEGLKSKLASLASEYGMALAMDEVEKSGLLKKSIDGIKKDISIKEKEIPVLEKAIEEKAKDELKELNKKIPKIESEIEKLSAQHSAIDDEPILVRHDMPKNEGMEYNDLHDTEKGNYFMKSESGGIVYIEKGISLDKIDWLNHATVYDLIQGGIRLMEMYQNPNSQYRQEWDNLKEDRLNLSGINKQFNWQSYDGTVVYLINPDVLNDLVEFIGSDYNGESSVYRLIRLMTEINQSYGEKPYFNVFYAIQNRATIIRSLRDYKSTVPEGKDPDEYIAELNDEVNNLHAQVGNVESNTIPDDQIKKYLEMAYDIISERRKMTNDVMGLVDGYMSFADLFNIELETVFIDHNLQKEMATKAITDGGSKITDENENVSDAGTDKDNIQAYMDKIEVYTEMIEDESDANLIEKYKDKIEVYEEMIEELIRA
jgi:hypothetical protein